MCKSAGLRTMGLVSWRKKYHRHRKQKSKYINFSASVAECFLRLRSGGLPGVSSDHSTSSVSLRRATAVIKTLNDPHTLKRKSYCAMVKVQMVSYCFWRCYFIFLNWKHWKITSKFWFLSFHYQCTRRAKQWSFTASGQCVCLTFSLYCLLGSFSRCWWFVTHRCPCITLLSTWIFQYSLSTPVFCSLNWLWGFL